MFDSFALNFLAACLFSLAFVGFMVVAEAALGGLDKAIRYGIQRARVAYLRRRYLGSVLMCRNGNLIRIR